MNLCLFFLISLKFLAAFPSSKQIVLLKNEKNIVSIPSPSYFDQEVFSIQLDNQTQVDMPLFSITPFCSPEKIDLNIQTVASFLNYDSYYRNPEFIVIDDFLFFIDLSEILRVFHLDEKSDTYINEISEQNILEEINGLSFFRIFYNKDFNRLYLLIDNSIIFFSIDDYYKPVKQNKIAFEKFPKNQPIQATYERDCFYLLMDDHLNINIYCLNNQTKDLQKISINEVLSKEGLKITKIQDLVIDNNILVISEINIGIILLNCTDKNNISLILIDQKMYVNKISLFGNSLLIIRSFPQDHGFFSNFLEEYYIDFSKKKGYVYEFNRNLTLSTSIINSLHISRKFMFLLQDNQIKIYRHSIPSKIVLNGDDFLKSLFAKDILLLERAPNMGKNDLIIGVFGSKITLFKIMELIPKLICTPNETLIDKAPGRINFFVLTKTCKNQNESIIIDGHFSFCNYSGYLDVIVTSSEQSGISGSTVTAGVIAALVITSVCFILILSLFVHYYGKLKEKLLKLQQKQYENVKDESFDKSKNLNPKKNSLKEIELS